MNILRTFLQQPNFLIFYTLLCLIPLPLASVQNKNIEMSSNSRTSSQPSTTSFKLIFSKKQVGKRNAHSHNYSSHLSNVSDTVNVVQLATLAEESSSGQFQAKQDAALLARQKLAQLSLQWAVFAQKLTRWKSNEVMDLTKKAQAAQILSLKFGSIATRLQSAVMAAQDVYNSAFDRYKTLASLAQAAENHSTATSEALILLQYTQTIREKWAGDEQARALRLSKHLQNILYDLKRASEFAQEAHEHALSTKQYIHYHY